MYQFYNENPLGKFENDCVIRSLSCATRRSWDEVYDELSDLAQLNGTMMDDRNFVTWYLDSKYRRLLDLPLTVGEIAEKYRNNIILCTMNGHICCLKYGIVYDTFDPRNRYVENAWIVA